MQSLITRWVNGTEGQLRLFEDDDEIIFQRISNTVQLSVQLTQSRPDTLRLQTLMRLGGASLNHFHGALALEPASGVLWLVQCLREGADEKRLLGCLEALLNQRDTWRAIVARLAAPTRKPMPTSLRSLPY
ncbi:type III secretion protein [Pseudomonas sp. TH34]|uniref:Type III secretion protein n=1 Tax=Pseudomonas yamanorum TaxID=515393 RepID=A0A143GNK4_9PSED|nr:MULTISPECIES: hypothetical protein [Pseudomonas]MBK5409708.1 type III secretion protein [Pseudomonas sp. TH34]AMW85848.1 type III secretion protein HrpG [Pseudomonas yamanorum]MBV6664500.1 type III secretion protein [Pseudomonas yamanorum]NVZ91840.1 type III secretion protein [Pseudomonas yamanorum]NWD43738.1 type III secretion protein [Pseudomonas yamanorum]